MALAEVSDVVAAVGRADFVVGRHVSYRQSFRRCGKPTCSVCSQGQGHGPYWYAQWREGKRVRSRYLGKDWEPEPARSFQVQTMGVFRVHRPDGEDGTPSGRARDLLTFLLSSTFGSVGREEAIETMWPEMDLKTGDRNLRVTLASLRRRLGAAEYIRFSGPALVLSLPQESRDDQRFERKAREAIALNRDELIADATEFWAGPFLPADLYNDWTDFRRRKLDEVYRELLLIGERVDLIPLSRRIERLQDVAVRDRTDESVNEALVRLLFENGRRSEAVRSYQAMAAALQTDLGTTPRITVDELAAGRRADERVEG